MTGALEGAPAAGPTLSERANAPRIGRAQFIGNAIGYLLLLAVVVGVLFAVGGHVPGMTETIDLTTPNGTMHFAVPNRWLQLAVAVLLLATIGELATRRRHDRGRSSVGVIVWLELVLGDLILNLFGPPTFYGLWITAALALAGLYFFVVLCLLPGTKGPNRYGPDFRA